MGNSEPIGRISVAMPPTVDGWEICQTTTIRIWVKVSDGVRLDMVVGESLRGLRPSSAEVARPAPPP